MVDLPGLESAARSVEAEPVKIKQRIIRRQRAAAGFGRGDELSDRLARAGDRDAFALFNAGDEVRKPGLGGVDIDSHAGRLANKPGLIKSSPPSRSRNRPEFPGSGVMYELFGLRAKWSWTNAVTEAARGLQSAAGTY